MKKVVFIGVGDSRNNGCWLMLAAAVQTIRKWCPVPVHFTCFTSKSSMDDQRLRNLGVDLLVYPWTRLNIRKINLLYRWGCFFVMPIHAMLLRLTRRRSSRFPFWKAILEADLVIDLSGDSLSSDYPEYSLATSALPLALARILGKKYMLCAQSIGPFRDTFLQKILIDLIRDAAIVTTRERITDDILSSLYIYGNVFPMQDLSFSVLPAEKERIQEICKIEGIDAGRPWVGFSVSDLISSYAFRELTAKDKRKAYIDIMAAFADWIIDNYDMRILFIPHVVIPQIGNDLTVSMDIAQRMKNRDKSHVISGAYLGDELKGLIGLCKLFVGSRMHATLSALSQGIPTMTYVYNHKAIGINGDILKQGEYLIDIRNIRHTELLEKSMEVFRRLVMNSEQISAQLAKILPEIVKGAEANAWAAINLFEIAGPLQHMRDPKMCTGCGVCAGVCISKSLEMQYTSEGTLRPRLVKQCSKCGQCIKTCPVLGFNITQEEEIFFSRSAADQEIGVVSAAYKGYSRNANLRWQCSSGGLVTAILAHLLKTDQVDAILTVVDNPEAPLRPKASWVSNIDELYKASGSKYTPVAPLAAVRDLRPDFKRVAFVGLPCHLWGLRLLEKNGFLKERKVVLRLGLFCGRTPSGHAIEFLLRKHGIHPRDLTKISYRGNGWPGGLKIETRMGDVFYPQDEIWPFFSTPYFYSKHCFFCRDFFAHLADLSFGDAWIPECKGDREGWSLCLVRSTAGEKALAECGESLHLEEISIERIQEAMAGNIETKYRQGAMKESMFPECTSIRAGRLIKAPTTLPRLNTLIKVEYFLSEIGKYRSFQYGFLDYPFNRFMKINHRILSFIKGK